MALCSKFLIPPRLQSSLALRCAFDHRPRNKSFLEHPESIWVSECLKMIRRLGALANCKQWDWWKWQCMWHHVAMYMHARWNVDIFLLKSHCEILRLRRKKPVPFQLPETPTWQLLCWLWQVDVLANSEWIHLRKGRVKHYGTMCNAVPQKTFELQENENAWSALACFLRLCFTSPFKPDQRRILRTYETCCTVKFTKANDVWAELYRPFAIVRSGFWAKILQMPCE